MFNKKIRVRPACLGLMASVLLLSGEYLQAWDDPPTETISPPSLASKSGCPDPDSNPWYILDSVLKVNHEVEDPSPKVEFFPLQPISIIGTGNSLRADAIPTGRIAQDMAGHWRYLPDINTWNARHEIAEEWNQEGANLLLDARSISCLSNSLDRSNSQTYRFKTTEWFFQGRFACLDPACIPRPPPATAEVASLEFGTSFWQQSIPNPNYLTWIEGFPPGPTCEDVFGSYSICAELIDETGEVSETCCIDEQYEGISDPNICLRKVNFSRIPPPPEE